MRPGFAASLLGRLRYTGSNLFGRAGAVGLKLLSAMSVRGGVQYDQGELRDALAEMERLIRDVERYGADYAVWGSGAYSRTSILWGYDAAAAASTAPTYVGA